MIWATVSSWSSFCWLYRPSPSFAANNIINLISVLTIWWCPCVESSLVLLEEGVCYDQCLRTRMTLKHQKSGQEPDSWTSLPTFPQIVKMVLLLISLRNYPPHKLGCSPFWGILASFCLVLWHLLFVAFVMIITKRMLSIAVSIPKDCLEELPLRLNVN